ncbi:uncharacterized protein CDAR_125911 [Caerostris darwini]|uniref:Uncharacterized protein n=1 Tax=Caerostris darwini TaxID=1538125 RepID=A0AAV4SX97_9ARAC|nr:uncharacterized protein CDAR_125911 [Caerostris darwini]
MSFYLTLPSDSSLHYFPNNKISSFVTQLPSPITLDGKWEVGLTEIIYPHTWYNVNETNNMFGFDLGDGKLNTRKLSPGSYETIPDILKAMALTSHEDPHTEFPIFYVYSDIVQPVVVGHVEAPLLRVVRISGNDEDVINVLYDRPHYVPVIRQSFQTIEIEIRLNSGNLVPFERGKCYKYKLHHESALRVCCREKFEEHYTNQSGSGIPHYEGISFQRGYGLGGVFRRLFRAALPFLVRGGKVVGKEALVTGTKVINDVLSGKDLETAAKSRSKEAGKSLARKAINRVQSMIGSPECVKSELELFHLPATQTAIEDGHWVEFHPLSNVFDGGPVEFHISGSGEEYVDLSQTQLYVKAKIVKADGKPLEKMKN